MDFNYGNGNIHCMDTPGSRLKALRKGKGLSQVQLSSIVRVDQSTISDIENEGGLSAENLMRLCEALETTPQYVMRGKSDSDDLLTQIKALTAALSGDPVNSDRMGKPARKVLPLPSSSRHNDSSEPAFGPALTKLFASGRGTKNERSSAVSRAEKSPPLKSRGGKRP